MLSTLKFEDDLIEPQRRRGRREKRRREMVCLVLLAIASYILDIMSGCIGIVSGRGGFN